MRLGAAKLDRGCWIIGSTHALHANPIWASLRCKFAIASNEEATTRFSGVSSSFVDDIAASDFYLTIATHGCCSTSNSGVN